MRGFVVKCITAMEFLKNYFGTFLKLSPESLDLIFTTVTKEKIKKKQLIVEQGKPNHYMYVIKQGLVKAFINVDGEDVVLSLWMENETFGDVSTYITGCCSTKSYVALEDLEVYKFDIKKFRALFDSSHEICNLGRLLVENYVIRSKFEQYFNQNKTPMDRYNYLKANRKGLISRVKCKDLASYIQMSPETLSRVRKIS